MRIYCTKWDSNDALEWLLDSVPKTVQLTARTRDFGLVTECSLISICCRNITLDNSRPWAPLKTQWSVSIDCTDSVILYKFASRYAWSTCVQWQSWYLMINSLQMHVTCSKTKYCSHTLFWIVDTDSILTSFEDGGLGALKSTLLQPEHWLVVESSLNRWDTTLYQGQCMLQRFFSYSDSCRMKNNTSHGQ